MRCEMCGSESELFVTNVEGAEMKVCRGCSSYGKVIKKLVTRQVPEEKGSKATPRRSEKVLMVKPAYSSLIKSKRERRGLKQEELAQKIGEKVSVIHQLETGHMKPSIGLARKLEKFLNVSLVEEYEEKISLPKSEPTAGLTIGDMLRI